MGQPHVFSKTLAAAVANNIAQSQSPGAGAITLNGSTVAGGVATLDTQRRIIITSGGNDTGITFTVKGTNDSGAPISETITGASGGAAATNLDFKTVTSVTHSGSIAGTVTVGTNTTGSTPWWIVDWNAYPSIISLLTELRTGTATWSVEGTLDDPNNLRTGTAFPFPFPHPSMNGISATAQDAWNAPLIATRLTISNGTGTVWFRGQQTGLTTP